MKDLFKRSIKKTLNVSKKAVIKNKHAHKYALKIKNSILSLDSNSEVYDYYKYFPTIPEYVEQTKLQLSFKHRPLISIVMPTYNTNEVFLRDCIESVRIQSYDNWELCIADDASPNKGVTKILEEYSKKDSRIKYRVRSINGHISAATNSAITIASGEYIALLDHDDLLWPNALYEIVQVINNNPDADLIYSDEDKIDGEGLNHSYPFFKPDWSPEFLESCNYITHFTCIRTSIVKSIGGFRVGYEGAQDWDLFIRIAEKTQKIYHIPKILYSWRIHEESTAYNTDTKPYVYEAQRKLLEDHIRRVGINGLVTQGLVKQHSRIKYIQKKEPRVCLFIYDNNFQNTISYIDSLVTQKSYIKDITIINSTEAVKETIESNKINNVQYVNSNWEVDRVATLNKLYNKSSGKYIVYIDTICKLNDSEDWLDSLLGDLLIDGVGAVGGLVVESNSDTIISAGITLKANYVPSFLLRGGNINDPHYMRSLHGRSRRNVLALDDKLYAFNTKYFRKLNGFNKLDGNTYVVDYCLRLNDIGIRCVYNPYVKVSVNTKDNVHRHIWENIKNQSLPGVWKQYSNKDPYFNKNYSKDNTNFTEKKGI